MAACSLFTNTSKRQDKVLFTTMNVLLSIMGAGHSNVKKFTRKDPNGKSYIVPVVLPSNKVHSTSSLSTTDTDALDEDSSKAASPNALADVDTLMFNSLLETYDCGEILGKGSSAQVFQVTHRRTGVKYACKVVHKNMSINDEGTMNTETEIMKRMKHENIVGLHELYETASSKWFILELANGGSLHTALAAEPNYTEELVARQFKQVLQGVQYLHSMGIVHRDLKQDNILCNISESEDGKKQYTAKIADFGLSAVIDSNRVRNVKSFRKLKEMWGTKEYFAPEVYKKAYGPQVDVWSLGCVLYELLSGETPFPVRERHESKFERFLLNGGAKSKRYFELRPGWQELSHEARDLIHKMLKVNPKRRLSVEECLAHPWIVTATATEGSISPAGPVEMSSKVLVEARAAAAKRAHSRVQRQKLLAAEVVKSVNTTYVTPKRV